jgi:lipopolysaccharide/colanic/teichoic acid biosynthesis glycosyltransferase
MRIAWAVLMGVTGALVTAVVGDLVSEEVRTRLERLPAAFIRLAGRWVPADARDEVTDEWLAELAYILRGTESLPISRLVRGTRFAMGLLRGAPAIGRELGKADEDFEAMADALVPQRVDQAAKRVLDVTLAGLMLVLVAPVMAVIAAAIRLTSPGPALFRQVRVGHRQSSFEMLKFRTMYRDIDDDSIHRTHVTATLAGSAVPVDGVRGIYKLSGDPRVTSIGRLLRKTSLDELPQLINVLRGHMSLVGPRPVLPWEAELFEPRHRVRFAVKPGMTGLWQVSGRALLTMQQALDLDVEYARRRNLAIDLVTLLRTILAVLRSTDAY